MKSFLSLIYAFLVIVFSFFSNFLAKAADDYGLSETAAGAGLKTGTVAGAIGKVAGTVLSLVGIAFFLLMLYGGFLYMNARGNETEAKKATGIIIDAVIGLVIVGASYIITKFVFAAI